MKIVNLKDQLPTIADLFTDSYIYNHSFSLCAVGQRVVARSRNLQQQRAAWLLLKHVISQRLQVESVMLRRQNLLNHSGTANKSFTDTDLDFFKVEYKRCRVLRSPANFRFLSILAFPAGLLLLVGVCKASSSIQRCNPNSVPCL